MKKIFGTLLATAALVSCQDQDVVESLNTSASTNGRRVVENFTFTTAGSDATRLSYDGANYKFTAGDKIGALLMDEAGANYADPSKKWVTRFNLVDYIQSNYPFTRNAAGEWKTEAKMVEGNYFMVYPYNHNKGARTAYTFSIAEQVMQGKSDQEILNSVKDNNQFVGYAKVTRSEEAVGGEAIAVPMVPVFGGTTIEIKNTGTQTYEIQRMVLRGTQVVAGAVLDPTDCTAATQFNSSATYFNAAQYTKDANGAHTNSWETSVTTDGEYWPNVANYNYIAALEDVLTYNAGNDVIEVKFPANNLVASTKTCKAVVLSGKAALSHGGSFTPGEAVLTIYTDKGMIEGIELNDRYDGSLVTNLINDKALIALGQGKKVTLMFDDTRVSRPTTLNVYTSDDLFDLIHWNLAVKDADLVANLQAPITITKKIYDEYKKGKFSSITVGGNAVTLAKDVPADATNVFNLTGCTSVTIAKGGTQNITNTTIAPMIVNKGTMNLNCDPAVTLTNNQEGAVININKPQTGSIINTGKNAVVNVNVQAWENVAYIRNDHSEASVNVNSGTVVAFDNWAGTATVNGVVAGGTNYGLIINNNKTVIGTNSGTVVVNGNCTTDVMGGDVNITNLGADGNVKQYVGVTEYVQDLANGTQASIKAGATRVDLTGTLTINIGKDDPSYTLKVSILGKSANARLEANTKAKPVIFDPAITVDADASAWPFNQMLTVANMTLGSDLIAGSSLVQVNSSVSRNGNAVTGTSNDYSTL